MEPKTWTFPSSSGGKDHTTSLNADGILTCLCPGWKIKKPGKPRQCKHMTKLIAENGWETAVDGDLIRISADGVNIPPAGSMPPVREIADKVLARAPMLASAMTTRLTGEDFDRNYVGWIAELKIDGHRVAVDKAGDTVTAWSYPRDGGAPLVKHIADNIVECFKRMPDGWYDGEYAAVGIGSKSWDASRLDTQKQFYVFDVLELLGKDLRLERYVNRRELLETACRFANCSSVVPVPQTAPTWLAYENIRAVGGEGLVLKRPESVYEVGSRSASWVKVKALEHHVVTITGFREGSFGPCSVILAKFDDGVPVDMKTKNNDWLRRFEADPQSWVGQKLTMQCQLRTKDGSARHPMAKELHIDHETGGSE